MKVAIADDHGIVADAIAKSLRHEGIEVPIVVNTCDDLVERLASEQVDVAIIDVRFGEDEPLRTIGLDTTRIVRRRFPNVAVLVLSGHPATDHAIELLRAFPTGVGYLRKDDVANVEDFLVKLARLVNGEPVVGESVVEDLLLRATPKDHDLDLLSPQERLVLSLMAQGLTNAGIARKLHLTERAIEGHVSRIFDKLPDLRDQQTQCNLRVLAVLRWLRHTSV